MEQYDLLFKIVLAGASLSGKTSFLTRYMQDIYDIFYIPPIGLDFRITTIQSLDTGKKIKLQVWDNVGQERFRSIKSATYRGAHGILLLFDCTDRDWSFKNVPYVFEELAKNAPKTAQIILVATKTDQVNKRQISYDEAKKLADRMQVPYIETSAKENINVTETFKLLVHNIENALSSHQSPSDMVQVDVPEKPALLDQEPKTWKYRCIIS